MSKSTSPRPTAPPTVWPARGRHAGPAAADTVRRHLERLTAEGVLHSHLEPDDVRPGGEHVFEARWPAPGEVTVRARLTLSPPRGPAPDQEWVLIAEAEQPWAPRWPSPAAMFWPQEPGSGWDHEAGTGARLGDATPLPEDDKELRRVLRHAVRDTWCVHLVVHEAMTPDARGREALVRLLPEGLRHRVVEHRAAPHRLRAVNWVLDDFGTRVPRGGAVVLPGGATGSGYDAQEFSVRSVFLDGTEPSEVLGAVTRFAALALPLPDDAGDALTALREQWHLMTMEEELTRARELVAMYTEALDAMTKSRDLYREAAERANEALAVYREAAGAHGALPARKPARSAAGSPFQQLARGFGRLRSGALSLRAGATAEAGPAAAPSADRNSSPDGTSPPDDALPGAPAGPAEPAPPPDAPAPRRPEA